MSLNSRKRSTAPHSQDEKIDLLSGHRQPAHQEKGGGRGPRVLDHGPGWEARPEQQQGVGSAPARLDHFSSDTLPNCGYDWSPTVGVTALRDKK